MKDSDVKTLMEDDKSDFVQVMYDLFGNALWSKEIWHPTVEDIEACFKVLNKYAFDSKLVMPEIRVEKFNASKHINSDGDFFIGRFHIGVKEKIGHDPEFSMYILIVDYGRSDLFNILNTLCHEMIHMYDYLYFNTKAILKDIMMKRISKEYEYVYNTHGEVFRNELRRINSSLGLDVTVEETFSVKSRFKEKIPMEKSDNTFIKPMDLLGESDEYLKEKGFSDSIVEKARLLRKALCHDKYTEVKLEQDGSISIDVY